MLEINIRSCRNAYCTTHSSLLNSSVSISTCLGITLSLTVFVTVMSLMPHHMGGSYGQEKLAKLQDMVDANLVQAAQYQKQGCDCSTHPQHLQLMILFGYSFPIKENWIPNGKEVGR